MVHRDHAENNLGFWNGETGARYQLREVAEVWVAGKYAKKIGKSFGTRFSTETKHNKSSIFYPKTFRQFKAHRI